VAEPRDDLVEDEDGPMPRARLPEPLQEAGLGKDGADVVGDGLDDDGRDLVGEPLERDGHRFEVVEGEHDRRVEDLVEDPRGQWVLAPHPVGRRDDVRGHRVVPAVIAALELHDPPASGRGPGHPEGMGRRLAPGHRQEDLLDRGIVHGELLRQVDLDRRHTDAHQVDRADRLDHGTVHIGIVVAEQRWPEGGVVVRVDAAPGIGEGLPGGRDDDQVLETGDPALAAVDPARDHPSSALQEGDQVLCLGHAASCIM